MISRFLADQIGWLVSWVLILFFSCLLLWGYHIHFEAILWLAGFSLIVLFGVLLFQYGRWKTAMTALERATEDCNLALKLPADNMNMQIMEMTAAFQNQAASLYSEMEKGRKEQEDYYTLWTHQAKLPLATLKLILEQENPSLRQARRQVQRLDHYLNMVLAYQRMSSQDTDYHFTRFDLDTSIRKVIRSFFNDCLIGKISIDFQPTGFQVLSDQKWLEFVLEQLLSNAVKYTEDRIWISMENETLLIRDNGPGILQEDIHRIFQKGFTGTNTRMDSHASGLGLYLVSGVLQGLHHPFKILSSKQRGTTVSISLSREKSRQE